MSYSNFRLGELVGQFDLVLEDRVDLFEAIAEIEPSPRCQIDLADNVPLAIAINTEKARSELIVLPVLLELRRYFDRRISLFSGVEFSIDPERGLTGFCDFLISANPEQLLVRAPVAIGVEAKNGNVPSGLGQCAAELVAAQIFNQRAGNGVESVLGVVTTGTAWQFLRLTGRRLAIDLREYSIERTGKILGILASGVGESGQLDLQ
ncbi:MAG: hypothetical protein ACFB9N_10625 [Geitlerinemataceae cyanobacterium]